jgi:hypothetical protein
VLRFLAGAREFLFFKMSRPAMEPTMSYSVGVTLFQIVETGLLPEQGRIIEDVSSVLWELYKSYINHVWIVVGIAIVGTYVLLDWIFINRNITSTEDSAKNLIHAFSSWWWQLWTFTRSHEPTCCQHPPSHITSSICEISHVSFRWVSSVSNCYVFHSLFDGAFWSA